MLGWQGIVPILGPHCDRGTILLSYKPAAPFFFQFPEVFEAAMIGVPQWDIVLEGGVAAQRLVASIFKVHVVLEFLAETQVNARSLACKESASWNKALGCVDAKEGCA